MNSKQRKTLEAVFARPVPGALPYRDIEALVRALGCAIKEREGSRVAFLKKETAVIIHRPHPGKEIKRYQIKVIREFLISIGIKA